MDVTDSHTVPDNQTCQGSLCSDGAVAGLVLGLVIGSALLAGLCTCIIVRINRQKNKPDLKHIPKPKAKTRGEEKKNAGKNALLFDDGERHIDYMLVYEVENDEDSHLQEKNGNIRQNYLKHLGRNGLHLEHYCATSEDESAVGTHYYKVHIPWGRLKREAEMLYLPKRIKESKITDLFADDKKSGVGSSRRVNYAYDNEEDSDEENLEEDASEEEEEDDMECQIGCTSSIIRDEGDYFTIDFESNQLDWFNIPKRNKETFFTNAERSLCVKEILDRTRFTYFRNTNQNVCSVICCESQNTDETKEKKRGIGIGRLLQMGVYKSAFPLHDSSILKEGSNCACWENEEMTSTISDRQKLYKAWAKPSAWYLLQPLDFIRKYFGEKVGIYFAWLGFYTMMLIPASVVGVACFVYGLVTMQDNIPSEDICNENSGLRNLTMCPDCDKRCEYWTLGESCAYARLTYVFDNEATVFFAAFMAIWSTLFLEFWKRKQTFLQYDWDVADFDVEEKLRPEFEYKAPDRVMNSLTKESEPAIKWYNKMPRSLYASSILLLMICLVFAALLGTIIYRIVVVALMYEIEPNETVAKLATSITASIISLISINVLAIIYRNVAEKLTDIEMPRTVSDYEDSLTMKMFLFQFVNFYGSIFYIAFFKGRFSRVPGIKENYILGRWRQDSCDPSGCLVDLFIQLSVIMIGNQALNNFKELLVPLLKQWIARMKGDGDKERDLTRWEEDDKLTDLPSPALFEEYLEMVIQFGFVTIFVAAFPLAPLFALFNNIIEIRLDAYKFVCVWKRGPAIKDNDIGVWFGILQGISFIAIITNAFIIGWTADFIPKMVYKHYTNQRNNTLHGYMENSMAYFNISHYSNDTLPDHPPPNNTVICRYRGYVQMEYPYDHTPVFWVILAARLAFIIVFQQSVMIVTWFVAFVVPDTPSRVRTNQLQERELVKRLREDSLKVERAKSERKKGLQ